MKYQDLQNEIRDLGFEDDLIFNEYGDIIRHAITRALKLIATLVKAPTSEYVLALSNDEVRNDTGKYDLAELLVDEENNELFDDIDRVVVDTTNGISTFLDYDLEDGHILVISPSLEKDLTIWYKERIIPVTESTQDDAKVQVAYPCEPLVALLAAHYVWLDDDEQKAILYWNEFDSLRQEIEAKAFKTKARIVRGF